MGAQVFVSRCTMPSLGPTLGRSARGKAPKHNLSGTPIIVCENVDDYRQAVLDHIGASDVVLELGSALGVTTAVAASTGATVVGVDKSDFQLEASRKRFPLIRFESMDAFDMSAARALGHRFNKILVDVSGSRGVGDLVRILDSYEKVFNVDLFIVKAFKLKRLMLLCSSKDTDDRAVTVATEGCHVSPFFVGTILGGALMFLVMRASQCR